MALCVVVVVKVQCSCPMRLANSVEDSIIIIHRAPDVLMIEDLRRAGYNSSVGFHCTFNLLKFVRQEIEPW